MKILLTGRDGQVGAELRRALAPLGQVAAPDRKACDLADEARLREVVRAVQPDVIVNAAAYTAVDQAESEQAAAFAANAAAPRILGEEAARSGALVVHFSTDYVFSGEQDRPYTEHDLPGPLNVYGRSKLQGELALADACARHLILRTSWVFGARGRNFIDTILRLAAQRDTLEVVADQHGAPTPASLLADVCAHLVRDYGRSPDLAFGTYHVTAGGATTWYDYARCVLGAARAAGRPLRAGPDAVAPVGSAAWPAAAARPRNSRLDTTLFRRTFGLHLPAWEEGVEQVMRQIVESGQWCR